jgi:hypothetical protein
VVGARYAFAPSMVTYDTPSTQIVVRIDIQALPSGDFDESTALEIVACMHMPVEDSAMKA